MKKTKLLLATGLIGACNSGVIVPIETSDGQLEMICSREKRSYGSLESSSYIVNWTNDEHESYQIINHIDNDNYSSFLINKKINGYEVPFSVTANSAIAGLDYCKSYFTEMDERNSY